MKRKWEVKESDKILVEKISKEFNIGRLIASILASRGLKEKEEIEVFLSPKRNNFHDPYKMPDMEKAVERIIKAINAKEKTIIYGDYDVDGITSSTLLKKFFKEIDFNVDIYIPNRLDEGYGLNAGAIDYIKNKDYTLIITVDCGITGNLEVELAKEKGIDVIITDHHEPGKELPNAIAVVDLKREDSKYPFRELAGVGVAFKLAQAISMKLNLPEETYLKYLDLAAIGTISDIVSLKDENRTISKLGLMLIKQTRNLGLKILLEKAGIKEIDSSLVSFGIAPRINACGRMGHEEDALNLMLSEDIIEARKLAEKISFYNNKRQEIEKEMFEDAIKQIEEKNLKEDNIIVVSKKDWHHGVMGIVSSKITDIYNKPSILISIDDEMSKGSGRSIQGFDLHKALSQIENTIEQFGGHSMAIGLSVKKENIEDLRISINEYAKKMHIEEIEPIIEIEDVLNLKDIKIDDVKELTLLEPYGESNKMPIFEINNLKIDSKRSVSEGKHLKLVLKDDNNNQLDVIGFNKGNLIDDYIIGDRVDVVGNLEINNFRDMETMQINLKDIRKRV